MSNIDRAREWIDADRVREVLEEARLLIRDGEPEIILNDLIALLATPDRAQDILEYGVRDVNGEIVWFPVDSTVCTDENARQEAVEYANNDQLFRLVGRRVSAPWEVTE